MSAVTSKVRLYDLAKDLKIDTKRLIEEVRREGVDVSVPSNSISKELAEKIRDKYFPKKEAAVKRAVRIVKKAARPVVEEEPAEVPEVAALPETVEPEPLLAADEPAAVPQPPAHVVRRLAPAVRAPKPDLAPPEVSEPPPVELETVAPPPEAVSAEPAQVETKPAAPGRQVRVLRPTAAALNAGIRPGERAPARTPSPTAATTATRTRERASRGRVEYTGTPGETATPQTTYIPPPDAGRRRSRRGSTRGGKRAGDGKGGRLDRDIMPPPDHRTLEERIAGRIQVSGDLKPVRLVEGSTVKEFAEKLGIKPKEVVGLLLQRGVFATINQALDDNVAADLGKRFGYDVAFVPFERSEEHTSELQSRFDLVCRLLLEKKK